MLSDCRHFTGSMPCAFHKRDGRACESCADYDPVASRILIVKLGAAGDVLRTTCILPALRRARPGAQITWVTERGSMPLLDGNRLLDRVIPRDTAAERLMVEHFDLGLGLDPDEQGGALMAIAHCRERAGYVLDEAGRVMPVNAAARRWWVMGVDDGEKRANRRTYPDLLHEICALHGEPSRPQLVVPETARVAVSQRLAAPRSVFDRVVVLNTGGGGRWAQKKWTPKHYLEFAQLVRREEPGTAVMIAGGPQETSLNTALLASTDDPGIIDAGCGNSIEHFAAIIEQADLVVTPDSLALHMAIALSRPVVAIVGPTSPWELEMYGSGEVVTADVPCLACYQRECDKPVTCMERLTPERVYQACLRVAPTRTVAQAVRLAVKDSRLSA
jgi:heptosyltransferase-2